MSNKQQHPNLLSQGVFIFVYLAVLTALEFFVAVTFNSVAILVAVAVVKGALVLWYYMHVNKLSEGDESSHESYAYKSGTNRLGLWLFLVSDSFVFGGLMVMRLSLLGMTRPDLSQTLGFFVTAVLLISSFFMNRGEVELHNGNRQGLLRNTMITFVLGLFFLLGVIIAEWHAVAGAVFYMMTGMHAFHVLTGLILLVIVWINGKKGLYDEKQYPVEAAAVYWHFIDLVWIFFYPALYLIGTAV